VKILVLQLARLGDIYLSWPTLRALHRQNPEAELHVLVRERFAGAMEGLNLPLTVHTLKTKEMFAPLLLQEDLESSFEVMNRFVDGLTAEDFDEIINLSFSPASSYLVDVIRSERTLVRGYCRQPDGYLAIPDDASAYFYAQVGVFNWNRYHLGEIFSAVAARDLIEEDWASPAASSPDAWTRLQTDFAQDYFVVHLSTSQESKSYPDFKWRQVLSKLIKRHDLNFVVIGAPEDEDLARRALAGLPEDKIRNLVGLTRVHDLFAILSNSRGLLSCDSVGLHMASLCKTPCFTLSFKSVNFWETGPRILGSRVLWAPEADLLDSERVVREFNSWRNGDAADGPHIDRVSNELVGFRPQGFQSSSFPWQLIEAIYTGAPFPATDRSDHLLGIQRLSELSALALDQLLRIEKEPKDKVSHQILGHIDEVLRQIAAMVPEIRPLIAWFDTERLRMGPLSFEEVLLQTRQVFQKLASVCELYSPVEPSLAAEGGPRDDIDMVK
jgi:ADP-heptose:LPS heptosyltransferase